jgi:hypothetical protein
MVNCVFNSNTGAYGGGMVNTLASVTFTNCTLSENTASIDVGWMYNEGSSIMLNNCIMWGDTEVNDVNEMLNLYGDPNFMYCDIAGSGGSGPGWNSDYGTDLGGNIDSDPLFIDANGPDNIIGTEDDNLRLLANSPCIDAGNNDIAFGPTDLNGFNRFIDDECTADTGNGTSPLVDMGAYEFLRSDIDSDGMINLKDYSSMALNWMDTLCGTCGGCDLTCDGNVDYEDLAKLAANWLAGI